MKHTHYTIILLLIFSFTHLTAQIRYVSKAGSSTPPYTSWATASDSIQKCIEICNDGDTVIVGNGVYKETLLITKAIYLLGTSMDSTIIDGAGLNGILRPGTAIDTRNNVIVENMTLLGKGSGISSTSTIRLTDNTNAVLRVYNCIVGNALTGIGSIISLIAEKNIVKDVTIGIGGSSYLSEKPFHIKNNLILIKSSNGRGISGANGLRFFIHNNLIISLTGEPNYGIYLDAVRSAVITNNLVSGFSFDCNYYDYAPYDSTYLANNIFTERRLNSNIDPSVLFSNYLKRRAVNNVIYNNGYGIGCYVSGLHIDYNLFFNNAQDVLNNVVLGPNTVFADPMFVKDTLGYTLKADYHLQKYSPAIDTGDPDILDIDGTRSDMGLFGGPLGQSYTYRDLAPKPPRNVTAQFVDGKILIKWNKNTEADLYMYRIYRDTVPNFIYDTTKIVAVISDTTYIDDLPNYYKANTYYYKITAIDSAINQSAASEEVKVVVTGAAEGPPIIVEEYKLLQNYPNPFNPSTVIPYRLKEGGYVKIMVYNLLGELIRVLVNGYQPAGYYEAEFKPTLEDRKRGEGIIEMQTFYGNDIVSGIYLYRIEVIGDGQIPRFSDMKKMMLIK